MNIMYTLENLDWMPGSIVLMVVFILILVIGILLVRRMISRKTLKANHDVAGFVFTNLGVLFSVLLGFTVVNVQQRFDKTKETAQLEASYLSDLYQDAEVFSPKERELIRSAIKKYIQDVIDKEWELLGKKEANLNSRQALNEIWMAYYAISPDTPAKTVWYSESISKLNKLMDTRLSRILGAEESLGPEMWTFLLVGGITLVIFLCFFGVESLPSHLLLGSILAASTAFLLFIIYSLDTAFTGKTYIPPVALEKILESLN